MSTISQKLLDQLTEVIPRLAIHIAADADLQLKLAAMYKIIVTGNGDVALPETVRIHSAWIIAHDATALQIETNKIDLKKETRQFRRQIQGLVFSQVLTFVFLAIVVWLGLR